MLHLSCCFFNYFYHFYRFIFATFQKNRAPPSPAGAFDIEEAEWQEKQSEWQHLTGQKVRFLQQADRLAQQAMDVLLAVERRPGTRRIDHIPSCHTRTHRPAALAPGPLSTLSHTLSRKRATPHP